MSRQDKTPQQDTTDSDLISFENTSSEYLSPKKIDDFDNRDTIITNKRESTHTKRDTIIANKRDTIISNKRDTIISNKRDTIISGYLSPTYGITQSPSLQRASRDSMRTLQESEISQQHYKDKHECQEVLEECCNGCFGVCGGSDNYRGTDALWKWGSN